MSFNFSKAPNNCVIFYSSIWCRDTQNIAVSPAVKVGWMTWNTKTTNAWPQCNKNVISCLFFLPIININSYLFSNITQHFSEVNLGCSSTQVSTSCFIITTLLRNLSCNSIYNSLDGVCCAKHIKDKSMIYT